LATT
jgi:hypothetical protein